MERPCRSRPNCQDNLKPLARRNALQVNHHSFNADAQRLISQLELALKAAEDSRILKARRLQEERERNEREAREAEERNRAERREQEKRAAEEKARKEEKARENARKERNAREKKEAEEKARKAALRKARQQEAIARIKKIFSGGRKMTFFIGGGIVILFLLGYIIKNALVPSMPASLTEIPQLLPCRLLLQQKFYLRLLLLQQICQQKFHFHRLLPLVLAAR